MEKNSVEKITNDIEGNDFLKQKLTNLLNDKILNNIKDSVIGFNPFRVLKLEHYEIRHSNFLAWLLNPQESHGLGDVFLKKFLEKINENNDTIISTETINKDNITIKREWQNIDILIEGEDFVCVIENKIYSGENGTQLQNYEEIIQKEFPDKTAFYIYLTLNEETPSDEKYKNITYSGSILPILEDIIDGAKDQVKSFIKQYINILEYDLQLKKAKKTNKDILYISNKHKTILDYLYEIKDNLYDVHFKKNELDNAYQQKIKAIQVVFSFQKNLQDERDEKIREALCAVFDKEKINKHGGWAYKLNLEDKKYPFKQVDYTSRPFENIMVRFYCGITKPKADKLIKSLQNEEIIKNIKGKKPFDIEFGFRIKNASGFGVLKDFLTDDVNKFDTLFELFKDGKYGRKSLDHIQKLIKLSCFKNEIASFNEFIKEKGYTELIILPYIYIHKEIENNKLNEPTNLSEEFKEITQQCFDLFQIKKDEFKELLTFPNTID